LGILNAPSKKTDVYRGAKRLGSHTDYYVSSELLRYLNIQKES